MEILQFRGLELPIFDSAEVLFRQDDYQVAAKKGKEEFVRTAELWSVDGRSLKERLEYADKSFAFISEVCEIDIANYTWGLCKDSEHIPYRRQNAEPLLPKGFLLVAKVDAIVEHSRIPYDLFTRYTDYLEYEDYKLDQVIYGTEVKTPNRPPRVIYADIEPILMDPNDDD